MRTFKTHTKTISFDLDEGRFRDTLIKLKTVWSKLKRAISSTFTKLLKKASIGQEVKLTIPGQQRECMFNENGELLMKNSSDFDTWVTEITSDLENFTESKST